MARHSFLIDHVHGARLLPTLPVPSCADTVHKILLPTPPEFVIVMVSPAMIALHEVSHGARVPSDRGTVAAAPQVSVAVALNETGVRGGLSEASLGVIAAAALHEIVGALVSTTFTLTESTSASEQLVDDLQIVDLLAERLRRLQERSRRRCSERRGGRRPASPYVDRNVVVRIGAFPRRRGLPSLPRVKCTRRSDPVPAFGNGGWFTMTP
jgi:hypothetical protein